MKKFLLLLVLLFSISNLYSQNEEIKKTIQIFFEGLHNGDTLLINKAINSSLKLQTIFINSEGKSILRTETKKAFSETISKKEPTTIWLEKLLSYDIQIDGNLASVWTPYEFYLNNNFSHCGVNSFQLFNNNAKLEIIYIVDTRKIKKCKLPD